jgi:hypothetical protein
MRCSALRSTRKGMRACVPSAHGVPSSRQPAPPLRCRLALQLQGHLHVRCQTLVRWQGRSTPCPATGSWLSRAALQRGTTAAAALSAGHHCVTAPLPHERHKVPKAQFYVKCSKSRHTAGGGLLIAARHTRARAVLLCCFVPFNTAAAEYVL